jgi:hypothetical protein
MLRNTGNIAPAIVLAVLVAVAISGLSYDIIQQNPQHQPPREERSSAANSKQDKSEDPSFIQIKCDPNCASNKTDDNRNQPRFARLVDKTVDDPVGLYTLLLGTATLLLVGVVVYQVHDARSSADIQANLIRDSIDLGNREFAATHRPKLRIVYIILGPLQAGLNPTAIIWITNIGDGTARVIEIGADIFPRRIGIAGMAIFHAPPMPIPPIPPVEPGQQINITIQGSGILTPQIITDITNDIVAPLRPNTELCAVGTIHYLDANHTRRFTGFFRIYNHRRVRFMHAPDDDQYAEWDYET